MSEYMPLRHDGNDKLFLAVEMSLVSTLAGIPLHIHAEGLRGTGKTTVMRWAKTLCPRIQRIKGCPFQCSPELPHCFLHRRAAGAEGASPGTPVEVEEIPMPFVEIGHGAKIGTILGSIDLKRLTDSEHPEAALLPGSIPSAHRGIIFIDEVNRLAETAPEITDILLSVMGTKPGKVVIEEVGLPPCEIQVMTSVWAASNPDEEPGPLDQIRRQLADRFDLVVPVERPKDPSVVEELLLAKSRRPWKETEANVRDVDGAEQPDRRNQANIPGPGDLLKKASLLKDVVVPRHIVAFIASLYVHKNVESLRAMESLELSARAFCALCEKKEVGYEDLSMVIPLVLRHRVEPMVLTEILRDLEVRKAASVQARSLSPTANSARTNYKGEAASENEGSQDSSPDAGRNPQGNPREPDTGAATDDSRNKRQSNYTQGNAGESQDPGSKNSDPNHTGDLPERKDYEKESSWFRKLFNSCQRFLTPSLNTPHHTGRKLASDAKARHVPGTQKAARSGPFLPVSPPKQARRISYLPWEDMVLPPDGKDGL